MVEIRGGVMLAGVTITALIDGGELALILTISEVYAAILGNCLLYTSDAADE